MKKKLILWLLFAAALLVLFLPVPSGTYKDGGTRTYSALTYKIVCWNRITADLQYQKVKVYTLADRFKSLDQLWNQEMHYAARRVLCTVTQISDEQAVVTAEKTGERFRFSTQTLPKLDVQPGSHVTIVFSGAVLYTDPAQITVTDWELATNLRHTLYAEKWLDKATAQACDNNLFDHIIISEIYENCFFARTVIPMPYTIKLNGSLSEEWCVGDQVNVTYENTYYDGENQRVEVDFLTVEASNWQPDPNVAYKPVIYLYPEEETQVSVQLRLNGQLTCTYPAYREGWQVTAAPDGTLTDKTGQQYNYLYWEGLLNTQYDLSTGFCVKGSDTAAFLEDALGKLGLTRREANEFIVYWLPLMEQNNYNLISFQTDAYTDAAELEITPAPDTLIRVFMTWQAAEQPVPIKEQTLTSVPRVGFTAVEWGGAEISN